MAISDGSLEGLQQPLLQQDGQQQPRPLQSNATSQHALVGSNLCPIESLDYEIFENEIFRQDWRSRGAKEIFQYIFMKWALCFLIGLIVGFLGFVINLAIENIAGVKFVITSDLMFDAEYPNAFIVFSMSNLCLSLLAVLFTSLVAPETAGSGIPEVKAYLNGVDAPAIFSFRTLLVKIVGIILVVSSSLNIGKAGPMVHIGACVAAILCMGGSRKFVVCRNWFRVFRNDRDRRDFITCGCAAGMAAAFRAPVGGVLFALEGMASWWRGSLLWRSFFTTTVVAIVLRAFIDMCWKGECGLFGKGGLIMYDVTSENITYHLKDVPPVLLLAVMGGILGSLYNLLLERVLRIYKHINGKGLAYRLLLACCLSIFTSCLLFGLPWVASCRPCPSDASEPCPSIGRSGNYKKFQCAPGYYNDLASLFFNTNDDAIKNLFSKNTDSEFNPKSMHTFFACSFFLSSFSHGLVTPAGLFLPLIVTGAAYGRLVGIHFGSNSTLNHGLFAVLGSAALLGGSMRMTVSLCVIILELTDNLLLLPLIMLVLLISKTVADAFDRNIYDIIMNLKGFPYLQSHGEPYMRQLTVGDVVSGPLHILHGIEKVGSIVHVLKTTVLKKKPFSETPRSVDPVALSQFSADDFGKGDFGPVDQIEDIELSVEEMEMFVDLCPFTNTSPYTVIETMSLAKALILFRQVGLRHLLVIPQVPRSEPVVGILTRHDFMAEHILKLYPRMTQSNSKRLRLQLPWLL
ncbi:putative chloride channel-like protein CLC-g isoform X2 [Andrographis paniculata]|uniref:putative chloride channel-like protein CLC-g isoform X2 n=1 Tax=Andrographis paniculata TaxID=175694 RepID=UPI0021E93D46|nr:putative chloride channel-like protein CLC-g isoform X2 [Andrographis paniculata]